MLIGHVTIYQTVIYCHVKCGKTHCGLISVADSYSGELTFHLEGHFFFFFWISAQTIPFNSFAVLSGQSCDSPKIRR